jgi:dihydrofolate synthase/folylpolyglutamate synthase
MTDANTPLPQTLPDWLDYLEGRHDKSIDLGLARIGKVCERLALANLSSKVILIGGTNGKGTTSRFIESYLIGQGACVGLFNSPHIINYTELVRINAQRLTSQTHIAAFAYIEQHRGDTSLTFFEYGVLAALKLFKDAALDYVIIEVGLGGRGDATNIVNPDVSVITTIAIDHQAWLGNDRETIGYEKAGIFRPGKTAIFGEFEPVQSVFDYAQELTCQLLCANRDFSLSVQGQKWSWQSGDLLLEQLSMAKIPLQNVSTALATLQQLGVELTPSAVNAVLASLVVEGRCQVINEQPLVIVDVAHNPQSSEYLAVQMKTYRQQGYAKVTAVVGMLADKDIYHTLANIASQIDVWHLVDLTVPRGAAASVLAQTLEKLGIDNYSCYDCVADGLAKAKAGQQSDELVIVFGSFHTIAGALGSL